MAVVESEAQLLRASGPAADRPEPAGRRRLRRPWWESVLHLSPVPLAALASVLLALGVGTGLLISGSGDDAVTTATRTGFGPHGARVALRVSGDHGRLVLRRMPAPPQGRVYQVWILKGNHPVPTHSLFTVPRDGQAEVDISESLKGADKVLVTDEPAGGSMQPTTQPVAGATLT